MARNAVANYPLHPRFKAPKKKEEKRTFYLLPLGLLVNEFIAKDHGNIEGTETETKLVALGRKYGTQKVLIIDEVQKAKLEHSREAKGRYRLFVPREGRLPILYRPPETAVRRKDRRAKTSLARTRPST